MKYLKQLIIEISKSSLRFIGDYSLFEEQAIVTEFRAFDHFVIFNNIIGCNGCTTSLFVYIIRYDVIWSVSGSWKRVGSGII